MTERLRLTVLMAVYNGATWLEEAVRSILEQDFRDLEFVIVDDGSADETPQILKRLSDLDPRVVLLGNESNRGQAESLNLGLRAARGDYVARQDADDLSEAGRLTAQVALLDQRTDVVLVSTNYHVIDADGTLLRSDQRAWLQTTVEYSLHFGNVIGGHTQVMFRKDAALAAGGYDVSQWPAEDFDLWSRLAERGGVIILPMFGMRYRLHPQSMTAVSSERMRAATQRIVQRSLSRLLAREITGPESAAVRLAGGDRPDLTPAGLRSMLMLADRLFVEGIGSMEQRGLHQEALEDIRRWTARVFSSKAAALFALEGDVRAALTCSRIALRWSIAGSLHGFAVTLQSLVLVKWRRWKAGQHQQGVAGTG